MFSLREKRTGSLKIFTSADVQFFGKNQVKSKKICSYVLLGIGELSLLL